MKISRHFWIAIACVLGVPAVLVGGGVLQMLCVVDFGFGPDSVEGQVRALAGYCNENRSKIGRNPSSLGDLWDVPSSLPRKDPWGRPFVFVPCDPTSHLGYVISWGSDGEPGGRGTARDRVAVFGVCKRTPSR